MVIIKLWGGLGNQMFQYALYCSFLKKGIDCKLDKTIYESANAHNGYELENIFLIKPSYCASTEKLFTKAIAKTCYQLFNYPYDEKKWGYGYYNERVANLKFGYLKGYWQTEKYFKEIETQIKDYFKFRELGDKKSTTILKKINETNSVSIHVRRGDYLFENRNWAMNIDYYKNAISLINQKIPETYFFIFSDDVDWAKENIKEHNIEFIDWNKNESSYKDMQLMSNCKHNIIANSSFSWWGAWLNSNKNKIVITPDNWAGMEGTRDILPEDWTHVVIK